MDRFRRFGGDLLCSWRQRRESATQGEGCFDSPLPLRTPTPQRPIRGTAVPLLDVPPGAAETWGHSHPEQGLCLLKRTGHSEVSLPRGGLIQKGGNRSSHLLVAEEGDFKGGDESKHLPLSRRFAHFAAVGKVGRPAGRNLALAKRSNSLIASSH